jgi:two-component system, cell cycle sensor histidine kinase and response regulator CckA
MTPSTGRTILVVDDEESLRVMLVRTLAGEGYRVLQAGDGVEALEVLEAEPDVSLVLTDLVMPRMNGLELAERLAGRSNTLLLFMSAQTRRQIEPPGPLLQKPFTPAALCAEVQRLLTPSHT